MRDHCQFDRPCRRAAERTKPARRVVALATAVLAAGCGATGSPHAAPPRPVLPLQVSAAQLARLPTATTFGTTPGAPQDPDPFGPETGIVLHPSASRRLSFMSTSFVTLQQLLTGMPAADQP